TAGADRARRAFPARAGCVWRACEAHRVRACRPAVEPAAGALCAAVSHTARKATRRPLAAAARRMAMSILRPPCQARMPVGPGARPSDARFHTTGSGRLGCNRPGRHDAGEGDAGLDECPRPKTDGCTRRGEARARPSEGTRWPRARGAGGCPLDPGELAYE